MRLRVIILAGTITACGAEPTANPPAAHASSELSNDSDGHGLIFDKHAHPYGASMVSWSERIWSWIYRQPAATNPLLDQTGDNCDVDQSGPVWFLPSIIPGGSVFRGERTCTFSSGPGPIPERPVHGPGLAPGSTSRPLSSGAG